MIPFQQPARPPQNPPPPPAPHAAPHPVCDGANCGGVIIDSQSLKEITCPCGYGYFDEDKNKFIPGKLVRDGKAPSRRDHERHVQNCSRKMEGRPTIGVLPTPFNNPARTSYAKIDRHVHDDRPKPSTTTSGTEDRRHESYTQQPQDRHISTEKCTVPKAGIEGYPLAYYLSTYIERAIKIEEDDCKKEWVIRGLNHVPETALQDIRYDSRKWKDEIVQRPNQEVPYSGSKTQIARQKAGPTQSLSGAPGAVRRVATGSPPEIQPVARRRTFNDISYRRNLSPAYKDRHQVDRSDFYRSSREQAAPLHEHPDESESAESDKDISRRQSSTKGKSRHAVDSDDDDNGDPGDGHRSYTAFSGSRVTAQHDARRSEDELKRSYTYDTSIVPRSAKDGQAADKTTTDSSSRKERPIPGLKNLPVHPGRPKDRKPTQ